MPRSRSVGTAVRCVAGGGIGVLGSIAVAAGRTAVGTSTPIGLWIVLIASTSFSGAVAILAIVFDFLLKGKAASLDRARADAEAECAKIRETRYWGAIEKGATEPANSAHYAELSDAAARYVAVEKNGIKPGDKTHGSLYGHHPSAADHDCLRPPTPRGGTA
jgi:hypothetical protein